MQIFIHLPQNEIITLDVSSEDTIFELKNKIYKNGDAPINMQRLVFGGKILSDDKATCSDYDITKECVILMLIKDQGVRPHAFISLISNILYYIDYFIISKFL